MTSRLPYIVDKANTSAIFSKPTVIINKASKSASDITQDVVSVFKSYKYPEPSVHFIDPSQLDEIFSKIKTDGTDLLVIYGGDGTCKSGAITAREANIPLVALPGGTMNMLPKALYGTVDWQEALDLALSQKETRWQKAGKINNHIFFCGAIFGDPIIMSEAREALRDGDMLGAVNQLPEIMTAISHGEPFEFIVDGEVFDTEANGLQIYCPYMTPFATKPDAFEIASVPQLSMAEVIGIGTRSLAQDWRDSVHVKTAHAKHLEITGKAKFDVLLDGELEQVNCPIIIKLEQRGVLVLAPDLHENSLDKKSRK